MSVDSVQHGIERRELAWSWEVRIIEWILPEHKSQPWTDINPQEDAEILEKTENRVCIDI